MFCEEITLLVRSYDNSRRKHNIQEWIDKSKKQMWKGI
jgi:hypothetical protein